MTDVAPTTARNAVVSAALDLFVAQGFEATSVEQIAQAAGVSRSTFFRQFGGERVVNYTVIKQSLFADCAEMAKPRIKKLIGYKN